VDAALGHGIVEKGFASEQAGQNERLKTNLYGYFYMAQAAVKRMKAGAAIVNTGSESGTPNC
jgi:NAD(P)-dependent dehydrogenase (short-subunit alcohol dehydrogenase family)